MSESYGTSRLQLLPDDDHIPHATDVDEDNDENEDDNEPGQPPHFPPLTPSVVFLFLLAPYLRLGAVYASTLARVSLAHALVGLAVAASLSAFCRQIWFLLGRHLRKSSVEDVLVYSFALRRRKLHKHSLLRYTVFAVSASFKIMLAALYLRASADSALLLELPKSVPFPSRLNISIALSILIFVLSLPKSLASKSIVYTTGLSVASYLTWLIALSRSVGVNERPFQKAVLWNELGSFVFACTTTMTVPLSASLAAGTPLATPVPRTKSFELLNVSSTILAVLLVFPIALVAASSSAPPSATAPDNLILGLRIAILVFSIPSVVVSIVSVPLYGTAHRYIHTDLALSVVTVVIFALSLVPPSVAAILDNVTLFLAVFGTFMLPALAHITVHHFRRPLSIIVPRVPSSTLSSSRSSDRSPSPSRDPLLQRKEQLLQRRRLGRRLLWDVIVWVVLLPISAFALVWAIGRWAQKW